MPLWIPGVLTGPQGVIEHLSGGFLFVPLQLALNLSMRYEDFHAALPLFRADASEVQVVLVPAHMDVEPLAATVPVARGPHAAAATLFLVQLVHVD